MCITEGPNCCIRELKWTPLNNRKQPPSRGGNYPVQVQKTLVIAQGLTGRPAISLHPYQFWMHFDGCKPHISTNSMGNLPSQCKYTVTLHWGNSWPLGALMKNYSQHFLAPQDPVATGPFPFPEGGILTLKQDFPVPSVFLIHICARPRSVPDQVCIVFYCQTHQTRNWFLF